MTTKLFTIRGSALWAKILDKPDEYNGIEKFKISIIPASPKDWNAIKESGIRTQVKKTEAGEEYITLSRPMVGKVGNDGKEFGGGQPLVLDTNKVVWPNNKPIGNGSEVEVLFATYQTRMGTGHRLETVMVTKHVPYEPMDEGDAGVQGLSWKDRKGARPETEELKEPKLPF